MRHPSDASEVSTCLFDGEIADLEIAKIIWLALLTFGTCLRNWIRSLF